MPQVSVIIPTYNRAKLVTGAIDSILAQTYADYEIIVVDDGSTDNTNEILQSYGDKIHAIYQSNKGVSAARNTGIRAAKGKWIACLDSDDRWVPEKLKSQIELVNASPVELGCVIANVQFFPPTSSVDNGFFNAGFNPSHPRGICHNMTSILLTRFLFFNQAAMISKKYFDQVGGYDEQMRYLEDFDLALKLSFVCKWGYDVRPLVLYHRDSDNSLSSGVNSAQENEMVLRIFENLKTFLNYNNLSEPPLLRRRIRFCKTLARHQHSQVVRLWIRLILAISRRMPWYPKPITTPIMNE